MVEIKYVLLFVIFIPLILYSVILRISPNKNKWNFVFIHLGSVAFSLTIIDMVSVAFNDGTRYIIYLLAGISCLVYSAYMTIKSVLIALKT